MVTSEDKEDEDMFLNPNKIEEIEKRKADAKEKKR